MQATRIPTQHTAIGRRKKRDTKPPNVNDIRTFVQVEKDEHGNYRLPVEIDSWTVLNLGYVVYDRPAFHNQRYIYPVGYKVKKWYRSMVDPRSDTQYTCEILDGGQEPVFRLEADDNPGEVYMGPTPTTVWTIAVRRAFAIRNMDYGHNPVGPDFFGLRKNTIAKMIQDLPNADRCKNYIWQTFKIGTTGRTARGKIFRPEDVAEGSSSSSSTRRPS
ncbi:F/Y-rich N-terminus-domain-containing protein [Syncephalastrum racemosum]|uniref:F/Y-rich N-terminus-domain-containing protein n=1 Tax=Syncephalastrum racemosum TaxID=13706 RepID=A0A1X2H8Z8_SYNRA|nr:F/Y-rich N-terminus-domain-containing protein [Syncephalastrum racemosum]